MSIPVVVGGGISSHSHVRHIMELGADGVQVATRFVATLECDVSPAYKQAYIQASSEDITIIKSPVGMPGRALKNAFVRRACPDKRTYGRLNASHKINSVYYNKPAHQA